MPSKSKPLPIFSESEVAWFWGMVDMSAGEDACWPWKARRSARGYGEFSMSGKRAFRANRVALFLHTGVDPIGLEACHSCDNPPCCNPSHLTAGTHQRNMRDAMDRGRLSIKRGAAHYMFGKPSTMTHTNWIPGRDMAGEKHPLSKLTASDVLRIRALWTSGDVSKSDLARQFAVSHRLIRNIISRVTWTHI